MVRFGPFELDPSSFQLRRDGVPVQLQPKVLDLLVLLLRNPGAVVLREDVCRSLWPDVVVTEQSLRQVVHKLREVLGNGYLETVPRRGLRFLAPVVSLPDGPPSGAIRVAIVEDDVQIRAGLQMLIAGSPGFACETVYGSVEAALDGAGSVPDVMLLDIQLPGMSGLDGLPHLLDRYPTTSVLILTVYPDEERVFDAICNGAVGYLLKNTPPAKLLDAILDVHRGGSPMSPEIARRVVRLLRTRRAAVAPLEEQVLALCADGHGPQSSADACGVTPHTVSGSIRSIYGRLQRS